MKKNNNSDAKISRSSVLENSPLPANSSNGCLESLGRYLIPTICLPILIIYVLSGPSKEQKDFAQDWHLEIATVVRTDCYKEETCKKYIQSREDCATAGQINACIEMKMGGESDYLMSACQTHKPEKEMLNKIRGWCACTWLDIGGTKPVDFSEIMDLFWIVN